MNVDRWRVPDKGHANTERKGFDQMRSSPVVHFQICLRTPSIPLVLYCKLLQPEGGWERSCLAVSLPGEVVPATSMVLLHICDSVRALVCGPQLVVPHDLFISILIRIIQMTT